MKRLRLVRVAAPEIVAYIGKNQDDMEPDYQCICDMGVAREYKYCPYCGAELAWHRVMHPSKEFEKILKCL